jgi:3-polyprenyl-4-hydroxybenzoate decarboxylase
MEKYLIGAFGLVIAALLFERNRRKGAEAKVLVSDASQKAAKSEAAVAEGQKALKKVDAEIKKTEKQSSSGATSYWANKFKKK